MDTVPVGFFVYASNADSVAVLLDRRIGFQVAHFLVRGRVPVVSRFYEPANLESARGACSNLDTPGAGRDIQGDRAGCV
jgi:hypothetical protein